MGDSTRGPRDGKATQEVLENGRTRKKLETHHHGCGAGTGRIRLGGDGEGRRGGGQARAATEARVIVSTSTFGGTRMYPPVLKSSPMRSGEVEIAMGQRKVSSSSKCSYDTHRTPGASVDGEETRHQGEPSSLLYGSVSRQPAHVERGSSRRIKGHAALSRTTRVYQSDPTSTKVFSPSVHASGVP